VDPLVINKFDCGSTFKYYSEILYNKRIYIITYFMSIYKHNDVIFSFLFQMLEKEMAMNADNLKSIVDQGNQMARAGHFDSKSILEAVKGFDKRQDLPL